MNDTPETDAASFYQPSDRHTDLVVAADFARKLERERDEARTSFDKALASYEAAHELNVKLREERNEARRETSFAASGGSAATSELSAIINAARERECAEHDHEIKWLLELPMTDAEWKRFNELTGWPSRKQPPD